MSPLLSNAKGDWLVSTIRAGCQRCFGGNFWTSVAGTEECEDCHPPHSEAIVTRRRKVAVARPAIVAVATEPEPETEEREHPAPSPSNFSLFGVDLFGEPVASPKKKGPLTERFEFPPFSVLDERGGEWQDRKRAWCALGIQSEIGRGASPGGSPLPAADYSRRERGDGRGRALVSNTSSSSNAMSYAGGFENRSTGTSGTSIFDPVLAELNYRWFCPEGGLILDPFAGGSVRGIVAGLLGFRYYGIDLRPEQVAANEEQKRAIAPDADVRWVVGDSMKLLDDAPAADFVFSCPPYGNLERYSDDPADLSTMDDYWTFRAAYSRIILKSLARLKPGRLAAFVVGDFRDEKGFYRGFVADTINAFRECGARLYNDAVVVTPVGSLSIRVGKQFETGRKLGKTHQNLLVFSKGEFLGMPK